MTHHCHWPGCTAEVPPAMWGCRKHWFALPHSIRSAIWKAYRAGQEIDKKPSREYLEAALQAKKWAAEYDARTKDGVIILPKKKSKPTKFKSKWINVQFRGVKVGGWFKAGRQQESWWVKRSETLATSTNGAVKAEWAATDPVWVEVDSMLTNGAAL